MPRGDKSAYTAKQKRQAEHIEEGYRERGTPEKEAEARAWATVNKTTGGGNKSGGAGSAKKSTRTAEERSASARKAAQTRARHAAANKRNDA